MSNGFFFVPAVLYRQLQESSDGKPEALLRDILIDFIAATPASRAACLAAYTDNPDEDPVCIISDDHAFDHPTIWGPMRQIALSFRPSIIWEKQLIAAAAHAHFNPPKTPVLDVTATTCTQPHPLRAPARRLKL